MLIDVIVAVRSNDNPAISLHRDGKCARLNPRDGLAGADCAGERKRAEELVIAISDDRVVGEVHRVVPGTRGVCCSLILERPAHLHRLSRKSLNRSSDVNDHQVGQLGNREREGCAGKHVVGFARLRLLSQCVDRYQNVVRPIRERLVKRKCDEPALCIFP